jgi:hypothetical protein
LIVILKIDLYFLYIIILLKIMFAVPTAFALKWSMSPLKIRINTIKQIYLARVGVLSLIWTSSYKAI